MGFQKRKKKKKRSRNVERMKEEKRKNDEGVHDIFTDGYDCDSMYCIFTNDCDCDSDEDDNEDDNEDHDARNQRRTSKYEQSLSFSLLKKATESLQSKCSDSFSIRLRAPSGFRLRLHAQSQSMAG